MVETEIVVLAENVVRLLREKKLSQTQVASRSAIHVTEVSRIERGLRAGACPRSSASTASMSSE